MGSRLALVIVVDGMRAASWGAYGNTFSHTPQLDELASRGLLAEWFLTTASSPTEFVANAVAVSSGVKRWLITDVDDSGIKNQFDDVIQIESARTGIAPEIDETRSADFFSQAVEYFAKWRESAHEHQSNGVLCLHFSGLCGPWDAPTRLREELVDEEDPEPPTFVDPPAPPIVVDDPDELLKYRVAYSAQVAVLDSCLAGVTEAFEQVAVGSSWLAMIVGSSGYSLGEHGSVGSNSQSLYSEERHVPWLVLANDLEEPLPRVTGFAQVGDIAATLEEWLEIESTSKDLSENPSPSPSPQLNKTRASPPQLLSDGRGGGISVASFLKGAAGHLRDVIVLANESQEQMIRTGAWMMVEGAQVELYSKPDDRWEANDIASRCPEIVDSLKQLLASESLPSTSELPIELISVWR